MRLTYNQTRARYELATVYAEKDAAKSARFRWDPDARLWYSLIEENAARVWHAAEEPLRSKLQAIAEKHTRALEMSRASNATVEIPSPEGLDYLPFQRAGIAYALEHPNVLIADDMGLGKTIQAIGIINADDSIKSVLIVCPASLKLMWRDTLTKWLVRQFAVHVLSGKAKTSQADEPTITIVNYDILKKHEFGSYDLVVLDEAHYIKNPKAQRTTQALAILARSARRVLLTGTPIVNRPIELFTLLRALDPSQYNDKTFWSYARRYADAHETRYGWDFTGAANLDELQTMLRTTCMIRRLKTDVLKELPDKTRQVVTLDSSGYDLKQEHAYADVVFSLDNPPDKIAFDEMSALRHELALAKAPAVADFVIDLLESEEKVIVFAHHRDVVDVLMTRLAEFSPVKVVGGMSETEKQNAVYSFQNDPAPRVFVGNIQAAGVGLTLTRARVVVFAELDWVPGNITQAEDRAHRIGQKDNVLVYHVVVDKSLDAKLAKMIIEKQTVITKALDEISKPFVVEPPIVPEQPERVANPDDVPEDQIEALRAMARLLAGLDADHARDKNDVGYNGTDTRFGHVLANSPFWSQKMARIAKKMLRKYHGQIPAELFDKVYTSQEKLHVDLHTDGARAMDSRILPS